MKAKYVFLLVCLLGWAGTGFAQKRVSGQVVDGDEGEPIIGATVVVRDSKPLLGTMTDANGRFVIDNVPSNLNTLVVSYVGMKTQEVAMGPNMKITLLPDSKQLDEVVVTALGISRSKKSLGYAQQEVKAEQLTAAAPASITSALTGKVAGTQINTFGGTVGASSRISIRGNSTLNADQQPLIVVDGVPINNSVNRSGDGYYNGVDYGSGLNDINVEDIESVDILKGGAAALYGMRAANGVVLITTKNGGKKGGTKISYDGGVTFDRVSNIPLLQNSYGQGHDGDEYHYGIYGAGYSSYKDYAENSQFGFAYVDGQGGGTCDDWDESWGPRLDIGIQTPQFDSNGQAAPWISRPNNVRDFFQTGITQNHMVSIASVSERSNVRASLSYRGQTGTVPNTDQERFGGMINSEVKLNKMVWMEANANYTHTNSDNLIGQGYGGNNPMISLLQWTGRQINMQSLKENWDERDAAGDYTFYNWNKNFHMNPYFNVYENTNSFVKDRFFGKGSLFFQPADWVKIEGRAGIDTYNSKTVQHVYFNFDYPNGYLDQRIIGNTEFNGDLIAMFNKKWGKFDFNAIFGANYRDNVYNFDELECDGLTVLGTYTASNATSPVPYMDHSHIRSNSVYGSASFGWAEQLYVDVSARNDWSSTLKEDIFYPSISLSWLPFESFNLNSDVFSFLKLRGGYAEVGNATSAYRNSYYYYAQSAPFNGTTMLYKSKSYPNFDLKPERTRTWEVGMELGMFNNRLHLDVAYYNKSTIDQILSVTTARSSGITSKLINAGEITNKGIEVQLSADLVQTKNFNWNTTFNFSKDESMVVSLAEGLDKYDMGWTWGISTTAMVGHPWGDITGDRYMRNDDGAIILDPDGNGTTESNKVIGNITPDALLSWRHDFNFLKNFNAGFMFDMRLGGDIWSQTMSHTYCAGSAAITAENGIRERACVPGFDVSTNYKFVIDDGSGNYIPVSNKPGDPGYLEVNAQDWYEWQFTGAEVYVFDGSFLKLREVYLGYDVPKQALRKTKFIDAAKFSFVGNNLALLWVAKNNVMRIDPETGGVRSDTYGLGFEQAATPSCSSYGFKVNLTF
ncbi:MAG: SusC/RagA family TonB-linked outer membrane protein [Bacteroidaceae bacterium]|nr:SusC/RagA family TonB-linked outer membrane protein [Bacteroidaceae bacterium]